MKKRFCAIVILISVCAHAQEEPQTIEVGNVKVAVWLPAQVENAPVILFSHGFHGCANQSVFLMQAFADAGYAVFAPNHKDAACFGGETPNTSKPDMPFQKLEDWNTKTYEDRRHDLQSILAELPRDERYAALNWRHVGLAGHSLGGYTVLAMGGAWPEWKDWRVSAVLGLSPFCGPFLASGTLKNINIPVMYQGGTNDGNVTPYVKEENGCYDQTASPKYYVEFDGAGHMDWTNMSNGNHDDISRYSIAFFDQYLKGAPFPQKLLSQGQKGISEIRSNIR